MRNRKHRGASRAAAAEDPACESRHGLVELDRATSLELLAGIDVGRVAWPDGDRVMIFPLNFVLDGDNIYAQTTSAAILAAAAARPALTFQGDDFEPGVRTGWTVLVSGPAEEVQPGEEADRVRALVKPWRRSGPFRVLRLRVEEVAGRRLLLRPGQIESLYIP
jgi:uncharacterized protein